MANMGYNKLLNRFLNVCLPIRHNINYPTDKTNIKDFTRTQIFFYFLRKRIIGESHRLCVNTRHISDCRYQTCV